MNLSKKKIAIALVGASVTTLGTGNYAQAVNLIKNGSFEIGPSTFSPLYRGSTAIDGWTVTRGGIDYVGSVSWQAADGNWSLDLDGSPGVGGIAQTFSTTIGQNYLVTFSLAGHPARLASDPAGNPISLPVIKQMGIQAAGQLAEFSFDITGKSRSDMGWLPLSWQFTAVDNVTTLEFFSLTKSVSIPAFGPALDHVSVVAVSEPKSVPEPLTILGSATAIGFGALLKREHSKRQKKD